VSQAPRVDATIQLSDGRSLAYCEWGVADGPAVLAFHGSPGSRVWWPKHEVTAGAGARLVTVDRPGYGRSDPHPERTVGAWASDVKELTDALGIDRFGVVGWSGGAPYAAAIAAGMPDRLTGVCLVSSGSLSYILDSTELDDEDRANLEAVDRLGAADATRKYADELSPWAADLLTDPGQIATSDDLPEGDQWIMNDPDECSGLLDSIQEGLRQGAIGAATDWIAVIRPWGFTLGDIQIPVHLWHGAQDPEVDLDAFTEVAGGLPEGRLTVWPDAGHFGPAKHWSEVLQAALGK
jgi:pimeloyl-ACP methyl ester carboxylesterase